MKRNRVYRKRALTQQEVERDRKVREQFQSQRPSGSDLSPQEYTEALPQRDFLSLMEFAAAIKQIRQELEMSLSDVSEISGIDRAALSRLESGYVDNPTFSTLERVANALGKRLRLALEDDGIRT